MNNEFNFLEARVEWDERHAMLLKNFLDSLTLHDIRYVILKNADGLPYENHSKDVDIVIEPGRYRDSAQIIQSCYKNHGISHYKVHKFERLRCWYGMNIETRFAIHIDLLEGFLHKGFEMFSFDVLYAHSRKNENGIQMLDDLMGNVVLLLHSTICYHFIKGKYTQSIAKAFQSDRDDFTLLLKEILGASAADEMVALLVAGKYKEIAKKGKHFSRHSKMRLLLKRPLFSIYNVADFLWEKICRLLLNLNRYNTMISVHAPDGTGKTTFIEHLGNELGFYYVCAANDLLDTHHFRPNILPNLGAAGEKAGMMKQDKNFTVPHRTKPASFLSSLVRITYYWLDYVIGVPLILRRNAQFDKITIFDRYIYDFLVDPYRTRIKLPYWIRKVFSQLVRQPRIVFVLDANADTIYARKQELNKKEIERQLIEFRKLSNLGKRVHYLDATQTPKEIAQDAIKIVIDEFAKKVDNT